MVYKNIIWTLHDMTRERIKGYTPYESILSPSVEIVVGDNITEWFLSFRPRGVIWDSKEDIGLFLHLKDSDTTNFRANVVLGIVGKDNKLYKNEASGKELQALFNRGLGTSKLLKRTELCDHHKEFITSGKLLMLLCELTIESIEVPKRQKSSPVNQIFVKIDPDIKIITSDNQMLNAHKFALARSTVMRAQMNQMNEPHENVINVSEDASIMREILRFLYRDCDELENLDEFTPQLLLAAEKYNLPVLKKLCVKLMIEAMTIDNAVQTLLIADKVTKSIILKQQCFDLIAKNHDQLSTTVQFKELNSKVLLEYTLFAFGSDKNTIHI